MATEIAFVDRFFKSAGLEKGVRPDRFWDALSKRFPDPAARLGECINARERGIACNPYPLKNVSLDFANAVLSQFDQEKLKAVALWVLRQAFISPGDRVLELGCDNGLLLCLLAKAYPAAEFVGVDPCAEAIALARQRADRLGLSNVAFECSTAVDALQKYGRNHFGAVLAVAVFHEVIAGGLLGEAAITSAAGEVKGFAIDDFDARDHGGKLQDCGDIEAVHGLLTDTGVFISVDRWSVPTMTLSWVRMAEAVGFYVDLSSSYLITYSDTVAGRQVLPLTYFRKGASSVRPQDVVALHVYPEFERGAALNEVKSPLVAELTYAAFDKRPLLRLHVTYEKGSERIELGLAGGLGYLYQTTTLNFRKLWAFPSIVTVEKAASLTAMYRERLIGAEISVEYFPGNEMPTLGITRAWLEGLTSSH